MNNKHNYDQRATELHSRKKLMLQLEAEAERNRFEAKNNGKAIECHISWLLWDNALTNENFTWGLKITFPFRVPKDKKMERFKDAIRDVFQQIILS